MNEPQKQMYLNESWISNTDEERRIAVYVEPYEFMDTRYVGYISAAPPYESWSQLQVASVEEFDAWRANARYAPSAGAAIQGVMPAAFWRMKAWNAYWAGMAPSAVRIFRVQENAKRRDVELQLIEEQAIAARGRHAEFIAKAEEHEGACILAASANAKKNARDLEGGKAAKFLLAQMSWTLQHCRTPEIKPPNKAGLPPALTLTIEMDVPSELRKRHMEFHHLQKTDFLEVQQNNVGPVARVSMFQAGCLNRVKIITHALLPADGDYQGPFVLPQVFSDFDSLTEIPALTTELEANSWKEAPEQLAHVMRAFLNEAYRLFAEAVEAKLASL